MGFVGGALSIDRSLALACKKKHRSGCEGDGSHRLVRSKVIRIWTGLSTAATAVTATACLPVS